MNPRIPPTAEALLLIDGACRAWKAVCKQQQIQDTIASRALTCRLTEARAVLAERASADTTKPGVTTYYKVLKDGRTSAHAGRWTPGEWRSVEGELVPCENGLHLARREDLVSWLGPAIWTAETDGSEILVTANKVVARRARILYRMDTWNERTARLFAADCAERVLPIVEAEYPYDPHPRRAIETARRYAEGKASGEDLEAAYWAAHRSVTYGAVEAAHSAAKSAAKSPAYRAAYLAARSAYSAADDSTAERAWQTERLFFYLEGGAV